MPAYFTPWQRVTRKYRGVQIAPYNQNITNVWDVKHQGTASIEAIKTFKYSELSLLLPKYVPFLRIPSPQYLKFRTRLQIAKRYPFFHNSIIVSLLSYDTLIKGSFEIEVKASDG